MQGLTGQDGVPICPPKRSEGPVHQPALRCLEQAFLSHTHGTPYIQALAAIVPCHLLVSRPHTSLKTRHSEHMVKCFPEARGPRQPLHSSSCFCQTLDLLHTSCPSSGLCAYIAQAQLPALPSPQHCEDSLQQGMESPLREQKDNCMFPKDRVPACLKPVGADIDIQHGCSKGSYHFLPELK